MWCVASKSFIINTKSHGPNLEPCGRLYHFFAKQKQLELFDTGFVVRTLKLALMLNFSQIGGVN